MFWTDLEVGDKIRYTKEMIEYYKTYHNVIMSSEVITISKTVKIFDTLMICYDSNLSCERIRCDNGFGTKHYYKDGPLFEIVELRKN